MRNFRTALLITLGCFLCYSANTAIAAGKVLYDDFSSGYLDGKKWWPREYVKEIVDGKFVSKLGNSSGMGAEFIPGIYRNNLIPNDPGSIHTIECDIAVMEAKLDSKTNSKSFAEISGYFYNTNESGGATGDIFAMVVIGEQGNGLEAFWEVTKNLSDDSKTWETIGSGTIPVPGQLRYGNEYRVKLSYSYESSSNTNEFIFTVDGTSVNFLGPQRKRESQVVQNKFLATSIDAFEANNEGFIHAKFDNVFLNNSTTVYDDFSDSTLDPNKWRDICWVREASQEALRANIQAFDSTSQVSTYLPDSAENTRYIQAKVRIDSDSQLSPGASGIARLQGYFYNESRGPGSGQPYNGYEGDIFGQILLQYHTDGSLRASAFVGRSNNADESDWVNLEGHDFSTEIYTDTYYTLSIHYTKSKLIFKCNDETFIYEINTPEYPPYGLHRALRTRIYLNPGESGYMKARFDDVYIDGKAGIMPGIPLLLLDD